MYRSWREFFNYLCCFVAVAIAFERRSCAGAFRSNTPLYPVIKIETNKLVGANSLVFTPL